MSTTPEPSTVEATVLAKSSTAAGVIAIDDVYIAPDRMREDNAATRKYIDEELAPSIYANGVIQPSVLNFPDGGFTDPITGKVYKAVLVAGWCRWQSCIALGMQQIPYTLRKNLRPDQLLELELAENLWRKDMTWQEKVVGIYSTHRSKEILEGAQGNKWGQRETGKLLGCSHGYVAECAALSKAIMAGDIEVKAAASFSDAKKVLAGRKEQAALSLLAQHTGAVPSAKAPTNAPAMGPVRGTAGIDLASLTGSPSELVGALSTPTGTLLPDGITVDLSEIIFNMDNRDWFSAQTPASVDIIYTDIPYGIDMDNLDFNAADLDRVVEAHDIDENVSQMLPFLENAYRVLKDQTYCLFWYDIKHHEKLTAWGEQVGFSVCPYPFIWNKLHPCRNRAGNTWPTKAVEYVMIMRKGTASLRKPMTKNYFDADGSAERKLQRNPFSKPFEVSRHLLSHFVIPGDVMVDCYAGEGSLVCAGLNMGLRVKAIEKNPVHVPGLTERVKTTYSALTRSGVTFTHGN